MTLQEFRNSLRSDEPPEHLSLALAGLWWDAKGDWTSAPLIRRIRYEDRSPEITDQDDVAAFAASCHSELPAVMRPGKVKNLSRLKIRNLFRRSAAQLLSPDVGDAVPG
jgi:hypothetical protein